MLKAGQAITIQGWRAKNGTNFANADTLSMPDGKKLSAGSSFYTGGQPGGVATSGTQSDDLGWIVRLARTGKSGTDSATP
jgi:hypothetical protein